MADCILCHKEIKGNINPEKIITCGWCVQILLTATRENKVAYREKLISEGKLEEARALESFITPETNGYIATFKKNVQIRHSKGVRHRFKPHNSYVKNKVSEVKP